MRDFRPDDGNMNTDNQPMKDATHLYPVKNRRKYGERTGFKITELTLAPGQEIPWHVHSHVRDSFYVIEGELLIRTREPLEQVLLRATDMFAVPPGKAHVVMNASDRDVRFLVIGDAQGVGGYDFAFAD